MERSIRFALVALAMSFAVPSLAMTRVDENAPAPAEVKKQTQTAPAPVPSVNGAAATGTVQVTPLTGGQDRGKVLGERQTPGQ